MIYVQRAHAIIFFPFSSSPLPLSTASCNITFIHRPIGRFGWRTFFRWHKNTKNFGRWWYGWLVLTMMPSSSSFLPSPPLCARIMMFASFGWQFMQKASSDSVHPYCHSSPIKMGDMVLEDVFGQHLYPFALDARIDRIDNAPTCNVYGRRLDDANKTLALISFYSFLISHHAHRHVYLVWHLDVDVGVAAAAKAVAGWTKWKRAQPVDPASKK